MDRIDQLLLDWHEWNLGWEPVCGYPRDAVFGDGFSSSRQWMDLDDMNAEVDRQIIEATATVMDPLVSALEPRLRIAVSVAVHNLHAGAVVWTNPRWPETQHADYQRAKLTLMPALLVRGLITREDLDAGRPVDAEHGP
jgi:hypothetical protein